MSLFLLEFDTSVAGTPAPADLVAAAAGAVKARGIGVIETHIALDTHRAYVVTEGGTENGLRAALAVAGLPEADIASVRLVGADIEDVKKAPDQPGFLVEWDFPEGLEMDAYLARKKTKSANYAQVPEIAFKRTYVREDMIKCLCLYDAPDEASVRRGRQAVEAPISRLTRIENGPSGQ